MDEWPALLPHSKKVLRLTSAHTEGLLKEFGCSLDVSVDFSLVTLFPVQKLWEECESEFNYVRTGMN